MKPKKDKTKRHEYDKEYFPCAKEWWCTEGFFTTEEDNKEIEDDDREALKNKAFDDWVTSLWDDPDNKIESFLDEEKKVWALMQAG